MGGDEFLLAIGGSLEEALFIRKRLNEELTRVNQRIEKDYQIQFSIGFSEYLADNPSTLEELIANADHEMYREKNSKKE